MLDPDHRIRRKSCKLAKSADREAANMRLNNAKIQEPARLSKPLSASSNLKVGLRQSLLLVAYLSTPAHAEHLRFIL